MITFLRNNGISISTSLDGNEIVHDSNRKTVKGTGTFFKVSENIKRIRESGISIGAIQTTTKKSLNYANEIDIFLAIIWNFVHHVVRGLDR